MTDKYRILHLSATKDWGGGENHILNLATHNLEGTNDQHLILCPKNSALHHRLKNGNLNMHTVPMLHKLSLNYVSRIVFMCEKYEIDLVHIHDTTALTLAVMASKLSKLPPLIFSKKTSYFIKNRKRTLHKYNHPKIAKIFCVSDQTLENCKKSITDHSKLIRIYHGTNIDTLKQRNDIDIRKRSGIFEDDIIIGNIANHWRSKDLATFVKCAHEVVNVHGLKNYHFIQIGQFTKYTPDILNLVKRLNLEDNIHFFNELENASGLIPQFDISLVTSQSEGLPQFLYESFYFKVPVVSTNVGGIPEIITDGENGMLSNPHEDSVLANKLIALSQDKILQEKFTERSYKILIENFSSRKMAEQTLAEYKKVLYGKN
ncbi:glycosyltransferase family 4 protein [Gramella sp. GC03-9]|uniref:Glycosyltransferase family 4 protein n=1 Tax=Christiangramia oceanisediminis TaxID=2920386 RepID=A0A9X2KZ76_9FLAO|nr:glycosyltransferase family 4 protein [Gramella oceanisediminis]MCP9201088.1 glycosyltransferase family 4 protein [Gramella oceanisediminis]